MTKRNPSHYLDYIDVDFKPARAGWRALYLSDEDDAGFCARPIAGWLVQTEVRCSSFTYRADDDRPFAERPRRIVAAVMDDARPIEADVIDELWMVLGPGQSDPTAEDAAQEKARRRTVLATMPPPPAWTGERHQPLR